MPKRPHLGRSPSPPATGSDTKRASTSAAEGSEPGKRARVAGASSTARSSANPLRDDLPARPPGARDTLGPRKRLVLAEVRLAGDRRAHLEERGIKPHFMVGAMTATSREDFLAAAGDPAEHPVLHHVEKYKLRQHAPVAAAARPTSPRSLDELGIELPSVDEPHTIDVAKYIANRVSSVALEKMRRIGAEFFFGDATEMHACYQAEGYTIAGSLGSPTSTDFVYLQRGNEDKIVMTNIVSRARLHHQVLQLHFAGVDAERLTLRGDLDATIAASVDRLRAQLAELPAADDKVCFFGARRQVSRQIQELLGNAAGFTLSAPTSHTVDSFALDCLSVQADGRTTQIIAFRMPNGDLAQGAVRALFEHGVRTLVMCGAGGALDEHASIGDYLRLDSAAAGDETLPLSSPEAGPQGDWVRRGARNITVNSPLEETQAWLDEARRQADCVDVESMHVARAYNEFLAERPEESIRLVAGLFVSDIVGANPLEDKITAGDAYSRLGTFVADVMRTIGIAPP